MKGSQTGGPSRRFTRDDLLGLKDNASPLDVVAMSIPPEIDVNGKGLTTEKGKELANLPRLRVDQTAMCEAT